MNRNEAPIVPSMDQLINAAQRIVEAEGPVSYRLEHDAVMAEINTPTIDTYTLQAALNSDRCHVVNDNVVEKVTIEQLLFAFQLYERAMKMAIAAAMRGDVPCAVGRINDALSQLKVFCDQHHLPVWFGD